MHLCMELLSTGKRRFGSPQTEIFKNSCQVGDFQKLSLHVDEEYGAFFHVTL